jgi:hypothetical protein
MSANKSTQIKSFLKTLRNDQINSLYDIMTDITGEAPRWFKIWYLGLKLRKASISMEKKYLFINLRLYAKNYVLEKLEEQYLSEEVEKYWERRAQEAEQREKEEYDKAEAEFLEEEAIQYYWRQIEEHYEPYEEY